jgi:hypothetical protein
MLPDSVQRWIDARLKEAKIKFPFTEVTFQNPAAVRSRAEAIAGFVAIAIALKMEAYAPREDGSGGKLIARIVDLTQFVQVHHALMPSGRWKETLPAAVNRIVATRNKQAAGYPTEQALIEIKADIENLLDVVDHTLAELSALS